MNSVSKSLNVKYACIQGLYFIVICCVLGYAAVYLGALGFSSTLIGILMALGNVFTTLSVPVLATYVDKLHLSLNRVLIALAGLTAIFSALLVVTANIKVIVAIMFVIMFGFLNAMMPLLNSLAFKFEEHGIKINYGVSRGIGSVTYAFTSLILGYLVKIYSPKLMPVVYVVVLAGMIPLIHSFKVKGISSKAEEKAAAPSTPIKEIFKKYTVFMIFLLGYIMVYFDHMFINNFFIYVVKNVGGDSSSMGTAVFLAAILELLAMSAFEKFKTKVDVSKLLKFSAIMYSAKHILTWLAPNMTIIYVAQVLQMFAYAIFIPASVYYVDQLFNKADAVKGQSLVTTSMTISGIIASFLGGIMIDSIGVKQALFVGMIISVIGTVIMLFTTQKVNNKTL